MPRRSFREILRKGRRDLHEHMQVAALYIAYAGAVPKPVTIRDQTRVVETGDQGSKVKGYASITEIEPRIIFMVDELADARVGALFSVAEGEAYRVERTEPANDITRTAYVTQLNPADTEGLPVPGDDTTSNRATWEDNTAWNDDNIWSD